MPCAVLDGGLQFLAPCWQHPPSVPWGVVLSHRGHSACSETVKERVCTKTAACLLHHDHTSAVLRLASVPLANSESWALSQGRGLRKGLAAGGGRVAGAAVESQCRTVGRVVTSAFAGVCTRLPALNPSRRNVSEPQFPCGDSLCLLLTVCEKGECLSSVKFILYTTVR